MEMDVFTDRDDDAEDDDRGKAKRSKLFKLRCIVAKATNAKD